MHVLPVVAVPYGALAWARLLYIITGKETPMDTLTPRQAEILKLIERYTEKSGYPPTRNEICQAMGFRSPNAAEEHLKALARKGVIEMIPGASRGIRLKQDRKSTRLNSSH